MYRIYTKYHFIDIHKYKNLFTNNMLVKYLLYGIEIASNDLKSILKRPKLIKVFDIMKWGEVIPPITLPIHESLGKRF